MKLRVFYILGLLLTLSSCGGFSKIQRNPDADFRFGKAKEYYENKKWMNCAFLCESVLQQFRGTEKGEEALYYTYMSYISNNDPTIARTYLKSYIKSYPRGKYIENARYNLAYCYYLESPDVKLDKEPTIAAIEEFDSYLGYFPNGENAYLAKEMKIEMEEKLAEKELLNVKLYYNLGDYQGNNYLSAVITARNAKKKFPQSRYNEELSFYILKSLYKQADESVESKQLDRFIDAVDEYHSFSKEYPESKWKAEADEMYRKAQKYVDKHLPKKKAENDY